MPLLLRDLLWLRDLFAILNEVKAFTKLKPFYNKSSPIKILTVRMLMYKISIQTRSAASFC